MLFSPGGQRSPSGKYDSRNLVYLFRRDDSASVWGIEQKCKAALKNTKLPADQQEIDRISAVSLKEFLALAKQAANGKATFIPNNWGGKNRGECICEMTSRTNSRKLRVPDYMLQRFGHLEGDVKKILQNLGVPESELG